MAYIVTVLNQFLPWETPTEWDKICLEQGLQARRKGFDCQHHLGVCKGGKVQGSDEKVCFVLFCVGFLAECAWPHREGTKSRDLTENLLKQSQWSKLATLIQNRNGSVVEIMSACVVLDLPVTLPRRGCVERWEPPARKSSGSSLPKHTEFYLPLQRPPFSFAEQNQLWHVRIKALPTS